MRLARPSLTSIALMALIVGLAVLAYWRPFGGAVRLTVEAPSALSVLPELTVMNLPVLLHLDNVSAREALLSAADCRPLRWLILTQRGQFVQSQQAAAPACTEQDVPQLEIAARTRHSSLQQVALQIKRYRLHQTYRVRVRFWGLEREARFQLIPAQTE